MEYSFKFLTEPKKYSPTHTFIVYIPQIVNEEQLFDALNKQCQFPEYFGFNWNAVYDCLRDFHWISVKKICLIHEKLPKLETTSLIIYLQLLEDVVLDWQGDQEHSLEVIFPLDSKDEILQCLALRNKPLPKLHC